MWKVFIWEQKKKLRSSKNPQVWYYKNGVADCYLVRSWVIFIDEIDSMLSEREWIVSTKLFLGVQVIMVTEWKHTIVWDKTLDTNSSVKWMGLKIKFILSSSVPILLDRPVGTRPSLLEITVGLMIVYVFGTNQSPDIPPCAVHHKPNSRKHQHFILARVGYSWETF